MGCPIAYIKRQSFVLDLHKCVKFRFALWADCLYYYTRVYAFAAVCSSSSDGFYFSNTVLVRFVGSMWRRKKRMRKRKRMRKHLFCVYFWSTFTHLTLYSSMFVQYWVFRIYTKKVKMPNGGGYDFSIKPAAMSRRSLNKDNVFSKPLVCFVLYNF